MSKRPTPEELDQRWSDLPLPEADAAWQDMSARLDQDERDRKVPFLPPVLSGCAGWAMLLLALAGGATWLLWPRPGNNGTSQTSVPPGNKNSGPSAETNTSTVHLTKPASSSPSTTSQPNNTTTTTTSTPPESPRAVATTNPSAPTGAGNTGALSPTRRTTSALNDGVTNGATTGAVATAATTRPAATRRSTVSLKQAVALPVAKAGNKAKRPVAKGTTPADMNGTTRFSGTNPAGIDAAGVLTNRVTSLPLRPQPGRAELHVPAPALKPVDALSAAATPLPKKGSRHGWTLSAGLGINQALPIGGQQGNSKNYQGKFDPFTEHVPSFYIRATKGKWYVQAEARFNAPQLLPAYSFSQKTSYDTAGHTVQMVRNSLQKVWYHQFPIMLNYQIHPKFSIGAGVQWSLLYRASGEQTRTRIDLAGSSTQLLAQPLRIPQYNDSFLYRSQWQLMLAADYHWRRWTVGIRYRADLEPFMRYTKPEGEKTDVRNEAFEAAIRFRVWQQKRKK